MKKLLKWGGIAIVVLVVIGALSGGKGDTGTKMKESFEAGRQAGLQQEAPKKNYEELAREDNKTVENLSILVAAGETNGQAIAEEVRKTCKKACNINVYDDKKAFELQEAYDQMMGESSTVPQDLQDWKKENYVFVADHLVGYVDFDTKTYDDYPYKDWYYKELKGEE